MWAHNGSELFFNSGDDWLSVATYTADVTFSVERRERLFDMSQYYAEDLDWRFFDVARDDERFLMIRPLSATSASDVKFIYVQNFFEELERRVGN